MWVLLAPLHLRVLLTTTLILSASVGGIGPFSCQKPSSVVVVSPITKSGR